MTDKQIYTAYIKAGTQMLRVAFEYKIIDYWGEPEGQKELMDYFENNHHMKVRPLVIEASDLIDIFPYKH